jgi:AMP-polyphosphate phosphotransferase
MTAIHYQFSGDVTSKKDYSEIVEKDRLELLMRQFQLRDHNVPVIIVLSGMISAGKSEIVNLLNEWMDTRFIETHVHRPRTEEELGRPYFWKYWRRLPGQGETGLFLGSWYTEPWFQSLNGDISEEEYLTRMGDIRKFEEVMVADGTLIVKIRLILDEKEQKKRLKASKSRPAYSWRMSEDDMDGGFSFETKMKHTDQMVALSHTEAAPWYFVDATDSRSRNLAVLELLIECFEKHLQKLRNNNGEQIRYERPLSIPNHLAAVDLGKTLDRSLYTELQKKYRRNIYKRAWKAHRKEKSVILVFEGADAAGKGGAIRRLIRALDARLYRVIQIAAPKGREKTTHYLHRFWTRIPRAGFITIYDRSWYGRVLVERVEGFASDPEWQRAYDEINQFEKELTDAGSIVLKFWLEISPDEQLSRFRAREQTEYKNYKITDEDWRNREKRSAYDEAVNEMAERTNTSYAPWYLIPAEDKKFARIEVLRIINKALKKI